MTDYRVRIEVGPQAPGERRLRDVFVIDQGDEPDADAVLVLDDLQIGWGWAGQVLPSQLEPIEATFRLATRDVALTANLSRDDVAFVQLKANTGGDEYQGGVYGQPWPILASVYGVVSELTADQQLRPRPKDSGGGYDVWTVYTVKVIDFTVPLNFPISISLPAGESLDWHIAAIDAAAQNAGIPVGVAYAGWSQAKVEAVQLQEQGIVDVLRNYFSQDFRDDLPDGLWRPYVVAAEAGFTKFGTDPDGYVSAQLVALEIDQVVGSLQLPGALGIVAPNTVGAVAHPESGRGIPADRVDISGQWRHGADDDVNAVTVRNDDVAVTEYRADYVPGQALRVREISCELTSEADMRKLARFYLPNVTSPAWGRDTFTYRVADPLDLTMHNDWYGMYWPTFMPELGDGGVGYMDDQPLTPAPVAIFGVAPAGNLGKPGSRIVSGRLMSCKLTLRRGAVELDFALGGSHGRPAGRLPFNHAYADLNFRRLREDWPTLRIRPADPSALRVDPTMTLSDTWLLRADMEEI